MSVCVYCGAALGDSAQCAACGAHKDGADWYPAGGPAVVDAGWRSDPTGRHEGRYFVAGSRRTWSATAASKPSTRWASSSWNRMEPLVFHPRRQDEANDDSGGWSPSSRWWLLSAVA